MLDHTIGSLFTVPPHPFTGEMAEFLQEQVLRTAADHPSIHADNVLSEHLGIFKAMGFQETVTRSCMMRPTEKVLSPAPVGFYPVPITAEFLPKVVSVMQEAYRSGTDERNLDTYVRDTAYFFENNQEPHLLGASSVILNADSHEPVGVCLVSLWEGLPLIYEVAVLPAYRSRGLGKYMICRAISHLEPFYPAIRLFVTSGNPAERLYEKLGFLSGGSYSTLVLKKDQAIAR
ncbi:GNAT family N-acetyltransferase [Paenibacillus sp. XY044]|uniref:GNAT family N-acetyltransferase n=1 Tax=Paenibacillus sp. XY044 TaxID=2026089 RepID=UPI0015C64DB3|nr:N-acetyltransferase [Paenibacillus sp. XY044]